MPPLASCLLLLPFPLPLFSFLVLLFPCSLPQVVLALPTLRHTQEHAILQQLEQQQQQRQLQLEQQLLKQQLPLLKEDGEEEEEEEGVEGEKYGENKEKAPEKYKDAELESYKHTRFQQHKHHAGGYNLMGEGQAIFTPLQKQYTLERGYDDPGQLRGVLGRTPTGVTVYDTSFLDGATNMYGAQDDRYGISDGTRQSKIDMGSGASISDYQRLPTNDGFVKAFNENRNTMYYAYPEPSSLYNREAMENAHYAQGLDARGTSLDLPTRFKTNPNDPLSGTTVVHAFGENMRMVQEPDPHRIEHQQHQHQQYQQHIGKKPTLFAGSTEDAPEYKGKVHEGMGDLNQGQGEEYDEDPQKKN